MRAGAKRPESARTAPLRHGRSATDPAPMAEPAGRCRFAAVGSSLDVHLVAGAGGVCGAEGLKIRHVLLGEVAAVTVLERVCVQGLGLLDACSGIHEISTTSASCRARTPKKVLGAPIQVTLRRYLPAAMAFFAFASFRATYAFCQGPQGQNCAKHLPVILLTCPATDWI